MDYFEYLMPVEALSDIYKEVKAILPDIVQENHEELEAAWKVLFLVLYTVEDEGVLALEDKLDTGKIRKIGAPDYDFFAAMLLHCVDAHDTEIIIDMMVNDYYVNHYENKDKVILFLYMLCIIECMVTDEHYRMKFSAKICMQCNLSIIPEEYRADFAKIIQESFRIDFAIGDGTCLPFDWNGLLNMHRGSGRGNVINNNDDWNSLLKITSSDISRVWETKKEVLSGLTDDVMEKNFFPICNALCRISDFADGAYYHGLSYIENMAKLAESTGNDTDLMFAEAVFNICDGKVNTRYCMMEKYEYTNSTLNQEENMLKYKYELQ